MRENLVDEALMETTFLWCVRRLGRTADAEDLAQDILCTALDAERHGREIENFHAWYWRMAENRLAIHLRVSRYGACRLSPEMLDVLAVEDDTADALLREEETAELHHALSRLSATHREALILYYLRGMSIREIAATLGVPEGTVKRRLFDAKNELRKGVTTMKKTGVSAYAPCEVQLWGSYGIPNYWNRISELIPKQIFAYCAREAHTVREIADEIGVAPVYFEDTLQWLLENRFLRESGNGRYLTDFPLYPAGVWREVQAEVAEMLSGLGEEVTAVILSLSERLRDVGYYGAEWQPERLLWHRYVFAATALQTTMDEIYRAKWAGKIPDGNGKDYRLGGTVRYPDETVTALPDAIRGVPWSNLHTNFRTSRHKHVCHANLFMASPFSERTDILGEQNIDLFMRIFENPTLPLSRNEEEDAVSLVRAGYLARREDGLYPTMPVMTWRQKGEEEEILREALSPLALRYATALGEMAERILLPHTRADLLEEFVHWTVSGFFFPVGHLFRYGFSAPGVLEMPEDCMSSSHGIVVYY